MKKYVFFLFVFLWVGCSQEDPYEEPGKEPENPIEKSYFIEVTHDWGISMTLAKPILQMLGFKEYASLLSSNVNVYSVTYHTEYPKNQETTASGLFIIPVDYNEKNPIVVYTHATCTEDKAPSLVRSISFNDPFEEVYLCCAMASIYNCPVLLPDYIGYGASDHIVHPYIHTESLGQASFDLIMAYKEYLTESEEYTQTFNPNIFITGYSEGGHAAVALHKTIEANPASGLKVDKTVAGSGPYDNENYVREVLSQNQLLASMHISSYLWALDMFKRNFSYSKEYSDIFTEENHAILEKNNWDLGYLHPKKYTLSRNPAVLFTPEFIEGVIQGTDTEFIHILKSNSLVDFTPKDSLIFVYGSADDWVYPSNSINTYNTMKAKNCKVDIQEVRGATHSTTLFPFINIVLNKYNYSIKKP